jgi:hypothetical protein
LGDGGECNHAHQALPELFVKLARPFNSCTVGTLRIGESFGKKQLWNSLSFS